MINPGDKVRHKSGLINNGWEMEVLDIEGNEALCEYFLADGSSKEELFPFEDLELLYEGDGGFKNEGEK